MDGKELHEVFVPKGTYVNVSIIAANRNADIWGSDVLEWKPDRWLKPLPQAVLDAPNAGVYSHLLVNVPSGRNATDFNPLQNDIFWRIASVYVSDCPTLSLTINLLLVTEGSSSLSSR